MAPDGGLPEPYSARDRDEVVMPLLLRGHRNDVQRRVVVGPPTGFAQRDDIASVGVQEQDVEVRRRRRPQRRAEEPSLDARVSADEIEHLVELGPVCRA